MSDDIELIKFIWIYAPQKVEKSGIVYFTKFYKIYEEDISHFLSEEEEMIFKIMKE